MEFVLSELSDQVVTARAAKRTLMIRGGGTRLFYGGPMPDEQTGAWLDLSAYHGVIDYEPSELVLTARAGTLLSDVEHLLAEQGQMLAFEPPRFGPGGTLGGCVASGLSGPRRMAAGGLSDFVLGTRLLDADGNVMRFGGEVMKNVAGYDVSRLLAGSLGILGAIVEVSVKVMPRPRTETSLVLPMNQATALRTCAGWRSQAIPVSATAWVPDDTDAGGALTVRLSGNESAVRQGAAGIGGEALDPARAEAFWLSLRDQTHAFFEQRPLWRAVLPPGAPSLAESEELHEWQGCLRWIGGDRDPVGLREKVRALGGWVTLYRRDGAPTDTQTFHAPAPPIMQIHRRLKQELDPAGVFNPHRLYPEF